MAAKAAFVLEGFNIRVSEVDEPEYLEKANLRFYQKANLLRATIFHEDGAMASGFLVDVENQMRRELGPEETEVS